METKDLINQYLENSKLNNLYFLISDREASDLQVFKKKAIAYIMPEFKESKINLVLNGLSDEIMEMKAGFDELKNYFYPLFIKKEWKVEEVSTGIFRLEFELSYQLSPRNLYDDGKLNERFPSASEKTICLRLPGSLYQSLRLQMIKENNDNVSDFVRELISQAINK